LAGDYLRYRDKYAHWAQKVAPPQKGLKIGSNPGFCYKKDCAIENFQFQQQMDEDARGFLGNLLNFHT